MTKSIKVRNFGGISEQYTSRENSSIWLQSIPYDGTSTWGKGADKGFERFLTAAENMELYDIETDSEVYRNGIHILPQWDGFKTPEEMFERVYHNTAELLRNGKFLTFFGGEHSISIGIIKAFYEYYDDLTVVQLDAHTDLRPEYEGTRYNHACALHDASQNCNLIQVGIRSMDKSERDYMNPVQFYSAEEVVTSFDWVDTALEQMTNNVYITLDLDVFDSSIMPSTGTPEPGGLDWYEVVDFLKDTFSYKNVVGFDIVELAPIDGLRAPDYLAAKLYYKMLSYKFFKK